MTTSQSPLNPEQPILSLEQRVQHLEERILRLEDRQVLEQRVQRVEDRQAIAALVARYCEAVDDRDIEALAGLFAADGAFIHADGSVHAVGRDNVRAFYAARLRSMGPTFHVPHGHLITLVDAQHAHGSVTSHAEMAFGERGVVAGLRYVDEYVREDGEWRFAERRLHARYIMDMAELPGAYGHPLRKRWPAQGQQPTGFPEDLPTFRAFATGAPAE